MKRINIGYFIKEGFLSVFSHGLMSFAAVCMIVACLLIMGSFSLLAMNVDENLKKLEDDNEFLAYIDENYTDAQIQDLIARVKAVDNVDADSVKFVTREEAKAVYLEGREGDGLYANMPDEVFRDRLSVHVLDLTRFNETVEAVEALPGVDGHRAEGELAEGFVAVRNAVTALAWVLVAILAAVSLFIIANTIRLATFTRREEIAIMKMCGATDGFIEWPFVVEGMILGLTGALIAFFVQWGLYQLVAKLAIQGNGLSLVTMISYSSMATTILAVFCGVGAVIGVGGSLMAIRKFLQV